ncbi:MAG: butyrate kinase [Bacteroidales bacterium]|nr:butyrate kinase [Bacteroidales bacterium]MCF6342621.1 butyrate kinase [Bacteroidales bacterium]
MTKDILIIYPETAETKIAVYRGTEPVFLKSIKHKQEDLGRFENIADQKDFRKERIYKELAGNEIHLESIELVMGRSGLIKPVSQGVYLINEEMVRDLTVGVMGVHSTNLGGIVARSIADDLGREAYVANPVVVDELSDVARITGHPLFKRKSIFHALNQKHVAWKYARSVNKKYEDLNLIICHIGSSALSVGAHQKGRVIDVNQAFDGGGPFSISHTGTLPMGQLVDLCFSGEYTKKEVIEMITTKGGYYAYLGTRDVPTINRRLAEGDELALAISYALSYQIAKEIASHYATLSGQVDAIILTGVIFDSERFLDNVKKRIAGIAPIALYPTVNDFEALAWFGVKVLKGEVEVKKYK